MPLRFLLLATALCLYWGAGCTGVEVNANNIEVKQQDLHFDAAPSVLANVRLSLSQSFEFATSKNGWAKDLNAKVRATKVELHATKGVSSLDFIQSATIAMSDAAQSQKPLTIMSFERKPGAKSGPDLAVTNTRPVDVTTAWSGDRVRIDVAVTGTLPTTAWSVDLTVWLNGEINYDL